MNKEERDEITNPPEGSVIYNTTDHVLNFYDGENWVTYGTLAKVYDSGWLQVQEKISSLMAVMSLIL